MAEHEQITPPDTEVPPSERENAGKGIWFFVEYKDGKVDDGCFKLAGEARYLADKLGEDTTAIIIGHSIGPLAEQLGSYGTDKAIVVEDERLVPYTGDAYTDVLSQLAESGTPSIILIAASTMGKDLAPRLAVKLNASFVANYTDIDTDQEGNINVRRAVHGGNAQATVMPLHMPLIGTVDTQSLSDRLKADPCAVCVSEAEIVIGVGKGLHCAENLDAVEELAQVLGASIGGSRRATDEHWIADERRIGLTGKTISPCLYLICGISGAFHHTLSIREARFKIAVNKDPNAPIAKMADLLVVGDMQEIIPELTKQLRDILRTGS